MKTVMLASGIEYYLHDGSDEWVDEAGSFVTMRDSLTGAILTASAKEQSEVHPEIATIKGTAYYREADSAWLRNETAGPCESECLEAILKLLTRAEKALEDALIENDKPEKE